MNTYCSFQFINSYKYTKPHRQDRMYKYALLRNRNFRCKERSKQILQKQHFLLTFHSHQFHIMKAVSDSKPSCHIDIYFFLSVSSTQETADGKPEVECQEDITHII